MLDADIRSVAYRPRQIVHWAGLEANRSAHLICLDTFRKTRVYRAFESRQHWNAIVARKIYCCKALLAGTHKRKHVAGDQGAASSLPRDGFFGLR